MPLTASRASGTVDDLFVVSGQDPPGALFYA